MSPNALSPMPAAKTLRMVLALAALALVAALTWRAAHEGMSNWYATRANDEINRLGAPGRTLQAQDWVTAMGATQYLTRSLRYWPDNAWALEQMGALQLHWLRAGGSSVLASAGIAIARERYRAVIRQRPTSAYAWANLALAKFLLDERDAELDTALDFADRLGPWEPEVQLAVLYVGLQDWKTLDAARRSLVAHTLDRASRRNAAQVTDLATRLHKLNILCDISTSLEKGKTSGYCGSPRAP